MLERAEALTLQRSRAVANGAPTDHPIPGLPFADDSHTPVAHSRAVKATGRDPGSETGAATTWPGPRPRWWVA